MICPDGLAVSSCEQWRNARRSVKALKKTYPWWTVTHGFYAEMGGYRVISATTHDQMYIFRVKELIWWVLPLWRFCLDAQNTEMRPLQGYREF